MTAPAENSLLVRYTPGRWRATAFGAKFVLSLGVSAFAVPLVGYLYDSTGDFTWSFAIMVILTAVIVVAASFLPRDRSRYGAVQPVPAE